MKRTRLITILVLLALVPPTIVALLLRPAARRGSVSVRFLALTNDATGKRVALFLASNSTDRLFVRGRSELERRIQGSNVISVVQITNLDYLKPRQGIISAIPCADGLDWRLKFDYVGQFHRREAIVYESSWRLQRLGLIPDGWSSMTWLPKHELYSLTTEWVNDHRNAQPDAPPNGGPATEEGEADGSSGGRHR